VANAIGNISTAAALLVFISVRMIVASSTPSNRPRSPKGIAEQAFQLLGEILKRRRRFQILSGNPGRGV
jgi:hypothetical protein